MPLATRVDSRVPQGCHSVDSLLTWPTGSSSWGWLPPLLLTYCLLSVLMISPLSLQSGGWAHSSTIYQLIGHCLWCSSPSCPPDCVPSHPALLLSPDLLTPGALFLSNVCPRLSTLVPSKTSIPRLTVLVSLGLVLVPWCPGIFPS